MLDSTKKKAESREQFSQTLLNEVKPRIEQLERESVTATKKCTEIIQALQAEMNAVFKGADESLKVYHSCQENAFRAGLKFEKTMTKGDTKKEDKVC